VAMSDASGCFPVAKASSPALPWREGRDRRDAIARGIARIDGPGLGVAIVHPDEWSPPVVLQHISPFGFQPWAMKPRSHMRLKLASAAKG